MNYAIPSLTLNGWIKDEYGILIKLFEYYVTSNKSQSVFHYDEIYSIKYSLAYGFDTEKVISEIKSDLTKLYLTYFDRVNVYVNVLNSNPNDTFIYLNIDIVAYNAENKSFRLTKKIKTSNGDTRIFNEKLETLYMTYRIMEESK